MQYLFKCVAVVAVCLSSVSVAARPLVSIYKTEIKAYHLIIVLRDVAGTPTGIFFGREDELHERKEAYRLPPPRERAEWSRVRLSLNRTLLIPPAGSAEALTLSYDAEGKSTEYVPASASVVGATALGQLGDEHLSAALSDASDAADVGACASVLRSRVEHLTSL